MKMTMKWSFSYNSFEKFHGKKFEKKFISKFIIKGLHCYSVEFEISV